MLVVTPFDKMVAIGANQWLEPIANAPAQLHVGLQDEFRAGIDLMIIDFGPLRLALTPL